MQSTFYNANKSVDLFIWCVGKTKEFCVKSYVFFNVFFLFAPYGWSTFLICSFFHVAFLYQLFRKTKSHIEKNIDGLNWNCWANNEYWCFDSKTKGLQTTKNETIDFNVLISNEKGRETDRWITVASVCLNRIWYLKMRSHVNGQHNGDQ